MKKTFTKEEIIKKHETNIRAASTAFVLPTVLGLIYIVRFLLSRNLNFYFSLSFTDMLLKSGLEKGSVVIPLIISAVYVIIYFVLTALAYKNPKLLPITLALYFFDFCCLLACIFVLWEKPINPDWFIDVIFHIFIFIFLIVGIRSEKMLKKS